VPNDLVGRPTRPMPGLTGTAEIARVGYLCAGWAACSRRWDNQFAKEERGSDRV